MFSLGTVPIGFELQRIPGIMIIISYATSMFPGSTINSAIFHINAKISLIDVIRHWLLPSDLSPSFKVIGMPVLLKLAKQLKVCLALLGNEYIAGMGLTVDHVLHLNVFLLLDECCNDQDANGNSFVYSVLGHIRHPCRHDL